ncbi:hypothetical protein AURDEDRAFT_168619 [Auricularia subglabra TFB-10046 SS5]|nr:hypothetical protein AURDEDRAFT_168619 [Auricularia subglabra TFB-10046 SS5]
MNGRGGVSSTQGIPKWQEVNGIMRDRKISILALQETHLDDGYLEDIKTLYPRLHVINSAHEQATSTAGVAFVLNRGHIENPDATQMWEIIPGRAMVIRIEWKGHQMFLMNVYGYNDQANSSNMWRRIQTWLDENAASVPQIDAMMGDMNLVEDEMDRAPLRIKTRLLDAWRKFNPGKLEWTWRRPGRPPDYPI